MSAVTRYEEVIDPVEEMLKKTGCMELHFKVQVKEKKAFFSDALVVCRSFEKFLGQLSKLVLRTFSMIYEKKSIFLGMYQRDTRLEKVPETGGRLQKLHADIPRTIHKSTESNEEIK